MTRARTSILIGKRPSTLQSPTSSKLPTSSSAISNRSISGGKTRSVGCCRIHTRITDVIDDRIRFFYSYLAKEFKLACDQCHMPDPKNPVAAVGSGRPLLLEVCHLLEFLLDVATLDSYKEAPCEYLPTLLYDVTQALVLSCERLSMPQLLAALKLCSRILQKVTISERTMGLYRDDLMDEGS